VNEGRLWEDSLRQFLDVDPKPKEPESYDLMQRLVENLFLLLRCHQEVVNLHYFEAK